MEELVGLEVGYQLSDRLQLNLSTRINTYSAFRNSLSLGYMFGFRKKDRAILF
ncbi:MAG: hypothetical protein JKY48_20755 [Flavobacteriales bacterium]|nr:hypothetical protein [Flavobacteriales bacterium]